jgi:sec-independent protein translocase protein TatB
MFGLGMGEILIILVLALILLGPKKLPDAAKQLGRGLREFRRATEELKSQFESELYASETPSKPSLVEAPKAGDEGQSAAPRVVAPVAANAEAPPASADNVPGLEAALAEPRPVAEAPAASVTKPS